jgi:hypothetical protein
MKEIPREITVTSSLNEMSADQLGNGVVVRGRGVTPPDPTPFYSRPLDRYLKTTWMGFPPPQIFASWRSVMEENYPAWWTSHPSPPPFQQPSPEFTTFIPYLTVAHHGFLKARKAHAWFGWEYKLKAITENMMHVLIAKWKGLFYG